MAVSLTSHRAVPPDLGFHDQGPQAWVSWLILIREDSRPKCPRCRAKMIIINGNVRECPECGLIIRYSDGPRRWFPWE